jgi:hypothetical protein
MKIFLGTALLISMNVMAAQMPVFLDIARDTNGRLKYMDHSDATRYCANRGARLPSIRELAQLSMSLGAKGIGESCGTDKSCYKFSNIQNADGSKDEFYYSFSGYQRPAGDLGNNGFWSSSRLVNSGYYDNAFFFGGGRGDINSGYRYYYLLLALCVARR